MELTPSPRAAKELIHFSRNPTKVANVLLQAGWRFIFTVLKICLYGRLNLDPWVLPKSVNCLGDGSTPQNDTCWRNKQLRINDTVVVVR